MLLLLLGCSNNNNRWGVDAEMISVDNGEGGPTIPWGPVESCPPGSKAIGYDTRNDQVPFSVPSEGSAY